MNRMPIKVSMISLGCPKNQVDAEGMLARLRAGGLRLVKRAESSDVVIVNTCGFIEDAKKESIENILEMARLKNEGTIKGIVVSGCLSQRYFEEMRSEFPEVDCILQVGCAGDIVRAVRAAYGGEKLSLEAEPTCNMPFNDAVLRLSKDSGGVRQPVLLLRHPGAARALPQQACGGPAG
jgi:ribosomal protein S12 methylthiotransferase